MKSKRLFHIIICCMVVSMALTACKKNKNEEDGMGDVTLTPTVAPTQPIVDPEEDQEEIVPGEVEEELDDEPKYISDSEAVKLIQAKIGERGYTVDLQLEHLTIGENAYFVYQISDSTTKIEPNVLVDKISGELLCYDSDKSTAPFSEFPLYTEPSKVEEVDTTQEFTKEDALAQLSKVPIEKLEVLKPLTEYTIQYDEWTTNINGISCYGINVSSEVDGDSSINMGLFYVAIDGSVMYKVDSLLDDFVEIVVE